MCGLGGNQRIDFGLSIIDFHRLSIIDFYIFETAILQL